MVVRDNLGVVIEFPTMQRALVRGERTNPLEHIVDEERELKVVLDSPGFQKAPAVRNLLLYLWRHRGEPISEYAIATEALGRKPEFDPKSNATVRVHVARLRQKLRDFYDSEGAACHLRISIPLGGHELDCQFSPIVEPPPETLPIDRKPSHRAVLFLGAACLMLAIACVLLYGKIRSLSGESHAEPAPLPRFWQSFFDNKKPVDVYLPTPVFFEWDKTNLKLRDPEINDFVDFDNSAELRSYTQKWGPPKLLQNYTVASDTFAALKLATFFERQKLPISFGATADFSVDSLARHNVILLGTPGITSKHLKQLMDKTNFSFLGAHTAVILNREPRSGEAIRYEETAQSTVRRTTFGLIGLFPGNAAGIRLLTLTARYSSLLASFLTSPASLQLLESAWKKEGSPEHFEVLVEAEMDGNNILKTWPVAIRRLHPSTWK